MERQGSLVEENKRPRRTRSFFVSVALMTVGVVLVLILVLVFIARSQLRSIYENDYTTRISDINEYILTQVDGDKVEEYAGSLQKDDYYYELTQTLQKMREIFGLEYVYIMVDRGEEGMYTYIFDAVYDKMTRSYSDTNFGKNETKGAFPGGEEVLQTGRPFYQARFYTAEDYQDLYYSYAPIFNYKSDVVGFLGTDMDASPMFASLAKFDRVMLALGVGAFLAVFGFLLLYGKWAFTAPLRRLSSDVAGLAEGDLDIQYSRKLLNRRDELGEIYRTFETVSCTVQNLVESMQQMASEVQQGKLSARAENTANCHGSYARLLESANYMLENNCRILDMVPSVVMFFDDKGSLLYKNQPAQQHQKTLVNGESRWVLRPSALLLLSRHKEEVRAALQEFIASGRQGRSTTLTIQEEKACYEFSVSYVRSETDARNGFMVCAVYSDESGLIETQAAE